jgi:hypothetical protein
MSPVFAYVMAFMMWFVAACLVWLGAGLMYVVRRTRVFSRPLCFAMLGTFPFVFAYQALAAPLVGILFLAAWAFWKILEPSATTITQNPYVIGISIAACL